MQVLVRIAAEVNIKSNQVRRRFQERLRANLRHALRSAAIDHRVQNGWTRLVVEFDDPTGLDVLRRVFGIASLSPVEYRCAPRLEAIKETLLGYRTAVQGKTFCIRVKRSGCDIEGRKSIELERELGAILFPHSHGVNLRSPDLKIEVEIRPDGAYFFSERIPGAHGLPLGVEGRSLCLISGGFDSVVAAWYMLRRGVELDFVHLELGSKQYTNRVITVLERLLTQWGAGYEPRLHVIDFKPVADKIRQLRDKSYGQVVLKRAMYRAAAAVADEIGVASIVLGEAIGQVSSQTLTNLEVIDRVTQLSVLRPLLCFDKEDIIELARRIGTAELSGLIKENCSLVPQFPITKARLNVAESLEVADLLDAIAQASAKREVCSGPIFARSGGVAPEETSEIPDGALVIDVRNQSEYDAWHLPGAKNLPFSEAWNQCEKLPVGTDYVIYCTFGTMSSTIAEKMQSLGYAVKV